MYEKNVIKLWKMWSKYKNEAGLWKMWLVDEKYDHGIKNVINLWKM